MTDYTPQEKVLKLEEIIDILIEQLEELKHLNRRNAHNKLQVEGYIINSLDCLIESWNKYDYDLTKWKQEIQQEFELKEPGQL